MSYAANFDKHMKRALDKSVKKLKWKIGWRPPGGRGSVDLAGLEGDTPRVLVEAELKKDDPAANVIKIWSWARAQKTTVPVLFVHGFSKLYAKRKSRLRERANFVGERMAEAELQITYMSKSITYRNKNGKLVHFNPKTGPGFRAKAGAGRLRAAARGFAEEVARLEKKIIRSKRKR